MKAVAIFIIDKLFYYLDDKYLRTELAMKAKVYKLEDGTNYADVLNENNYELVTTINNNRATFELWLLSKDHEPTEWKMILKNKFDLDEVLTEEQQEKFVFDKGSNDLRALVVINNKRDIFVVPYGMGSFDIKDFIDPDFGLDFAEKALSRESIDKQTVDFFQRSKMRELTNYRSKNSSIISATESVSFISGAPDDTSRYGNRIECGFSVTFTISSKNYFDDLVELVNNITELMNIRDRPNYLLPRIKRLNKKDPLNEDLFSSIYDSIRNDEFENIDLLSVIEEDGNLYNLSAFDVVKARVRENSRTIKELEDYSLNSIKKYIEEMIEDRYTIKLEFINLTFLGDDLAGLEIPLVDVLYAFINNERKDYALQYGYWGEYNREYLRKLDETINRIPLSIEEDPSRHNNASEDTYIAENVVSNRRSIHRQNVKPNDDYGGRRIGIEVGDLYNQVDDEVYIVKKGGDTKDSIYSLEQAILSIHVLRNLVNFDTSLIELDNDQLSNIKKVTIKWLYFTKEDGITSYYTYSNGRPKNQQIIDRILNHTDEEFILTDNIHSILLKNKIVEWYLSCMEYNYASEINLETPVVNQLIENDK